jgi:membrane protein
VSGFSRTFRGNSLAAYLGVLAYFRVPIGWGAILKRTFKEAYDDDCLNLAAELAYYFLLALFPALLTLIAFASFFPIENLIDNMMAMLGRFAPGEVLKILQEQIREISQGKHGGLFTFGFFFTLWSSSGALVSVITTLNRAYDITESRPWWKVRLTAMTLTIALALFVLLSFALILWGPTAAETLARRFYLGDAFAWTWKVVQWPVVFALVVSGVAMVYYYAPDAEQDWIWITPGSVLATVLWLLTSLGFKFYVTQFANFNETYGTIGGIIVLMLWFYLTGLAILVGAELNAEIEHASPYGKEPGERTADGRKAIGLARLHEAELQTRPAVPVFAYESNCDVDRVGAVPKRLPARTASYGFSDLVIGAIAIIPLTIAGAIRRVFRARA